VLTSVLVVFFHVDEWIVGGGSSCSGVSKLGSAECVPVHPANLAVHRGGGDQGGTRYPTVRPLRRGVHRATVRNAPDPARRIVSRIMVSGRNFGSAGGSSR
jgi:hypothetical protein